MKQLVKFSESWTSNCNSHAGNSNSAAENTVDGYLIYWLPRSFLLIPDLFLYIVHLRCNSKADQSATTENDNLDADKTVNCASIGTESARVRSFVWYMYMWNKARCTVKPLSQKSKPSAEPTAQVTIV